MLPRATEASCATNDQELKIVVLERKHRAGKEKSGFGK